MESLNQSAALVALSFLAPLALGHDDGTPIPGEFVIITTPGTTLDDVRAAHPSLTLTSLRQFTPARIHLLGVPVGQEDAYEVQLGADTALVRVAEKNRTVASPEHGTTQSLFLRTNAETYAQQPAYRSINPPPATSRRGPSGTLVAVLDTGVAPHPDLISRLELGGYNFITDTVDTDESECLPGSGLVGHGTYVAGLIALTDPYARILPVTVLGCDGVGNSFSVACGIYHAVEQGAGVINMSFATTFPSNLVETAVVDAGAAGVLCVSSVSNAALDLNNNDNRIYPSRFDQVVAVGGLAGTSPGGPWTRAAFSDWGRPIDIGAPATDVTSMWFDGSEYAYADGSGTSYGAAFVSGVASMVRAKYGPHDALWMKDRLCVSAREVFIGVPYAMGCGHRDDGIASLIDAGRAVCLADFNADLAVDFFDYDAFVICFMGEGCPQDVSADFDGDGTVDFFDYDAFVVAFEGGC
ncbi:MAG: S8 family serine peptidase [Planctomycetota bacterium]